MGDVTTYTVTLPKGTPDSLWTSIYKAVDVGPAMWTVKEDIGSPIHLRASVDMIEDIAQQIEAVFEDEGYASPFRVTESGYDSVGRRLHADPQLGWHLTAVDEQNRPVVTWEHLTSVPDNTTVRELMDQVNGQAWKDAWTAVEAQAAQTHDRKGA